jgi:prepilin-type N-terminal cleavage/methylation domain-containing protein
MQKRVSLQAILRHPRQAFTLIELLIVIIIIGLLTTLATTSYITAQRNARDNARKATVSSLSNAVEAFYQAKRRFPGLIGNEGAANIPTIQERDSWAGCLALDNSFGKSSIVYYSFPTIAGGMNEFRPCNDISRGIAAGFNPMQYAPYPNWIPELGAYMNPAPLELAYRNSSGEYSGTLDTASGEFITSQHDMLGTGAPQAFAYRRLVNGYMVYTRLENNRTNLCGTLNSCQFADSPLYSNGSTGTVEILVDNPNVFMIRK